MDENADQDEHMNSDEEVEQDRGLLKCKIHIRSLVVLNSDITLFINFMLLLY